LRAGPLLVRLALAAVALLTVVAGLEVSPELQIGALVLVIGVGIGVETRGTRRAARPAPG
jgi:hypothetical protein